MKNLFISGDILLPKNADMRLWSVIACDQYTAQPEYWDALDSTVGACHSTLRLMLPEAYLESRDVQSETKIINTAMENYLANDVFQLIENSYIYVERDMTVGEKRRGILGLIDLEAYDYTAESVSPVRPTEGTVESRLPSRVKVRENAVLEMPHIVVLVDDPENTLFVGLDICEKLYDFDLIDGGGHIIGRRVFGDAADKVQTALEKLAEPEYLEKRYNLAGKPPVIFAMGDGNHSFATARKCWETIKNTLPESERAEHPARFSLVELVNIHDKSISFEPIHRVLFETDTADFFAEAEAFFATLCKQGKGRHTIRVLCGNDSREVTVEGQTIGNLIALAQSFCADFIARHGGYIDYIHDDDSAVKFSAEAGACGLLLPVPEKDELFSSIIDSGAFPAKSFSIGPARDKRYYLECRTIRK